MNSNVSKKILVTLTNDVISDRRMLRITDSLQNSNYDVTIIGRKLSGRKYSNIPTNVKLISCLFNTGFCFYAEYNIRLLFLLLFSKFDILYAVDLDTLMACGMASKIKNRPFVFDSHEYFTEVPELINKQLVKSVWNKIGSIFIKRADLRITVGQRLSEALVDKYNVDFNVIRNMGSYYHLPLHGRIVNPTKLVYLGVLNEGRGLPQLIEAMNYLPNIHLSLLGKGDLELELRDQVRGLGLSNRIVFKGQIGAEKVIDELTKYHVGVNLLESKSESYRLSLANKYFDYIQAELPSIQMKFPEYQALNEVHDVAVLIDDISIDNIVKGVRQLTSSIHVYQDKVTNCQSAKNVYCWELEENKFLQLIDQIKTSN